MNDNFGLPPEGENKPVDEKQRIADLRAKAEAQAAAEFDEDAVFAKLLAEARARRSAALTKDEVELPTNTDALPEEYDRINIYRGAGKQDLSYAPLGLDGLFFKVPRGEDVILPHIVVTECLDHAVEDVTIKSQGGIVFRPTQRFPYQFKGKATKAEYQEYQKQQREKARWELAQAAA